MSVIGFTGTQRGMTEPQKVALSRELRRARSFRHGDCIGADAEAHAIAKSLDLDVVVFPPEDPTKRAFCTGAYATATPAPYMVRNRQIVVTSTELVAAPKESREVLRSGTWSTIRYARRLGRPITIIYPDGTTQQENQ